MKASYVTVDWSRFEPYYSKYIDVRLKNKDKVIEMAKALYEQGNVYSEQFKTEEAELCYMAAYCACYIWDSKYAELTQLYRKSANKTYD
ncbi:MAG: hypothetical protein J6Y00_06090, partial [Paludibacteraceae bacterium]|nr:hypothetical protein [Paludibacteraceae bacterium]